MANYRAPLRSGFVVCPTCLTTWGKMARAVVRRQEGRDVSAGSAGRGCRKRSVGEDGTSLRLCLDGADLVDQRTATNA